MISPIEPHTFASKEGKAVWFLGTLTFIKATPESSRGAFAFVEQWMPPGFATPYHIHQLEDESFYLIEGEATFVCDGKELTAGPGAYVFGPRGVPHGFRIEGTKPARMLVWATPGGFDRFVIEAGEPAQRLEIPPPSPPDIAKLTEIAAKYKIEILGPSSRLEHFHFYFDMARAVRSGRSSMEWPRTERHFCKHQK